MDDLLQLFLQADKAGLKWYAEAHDECVRLAEELQIDVWKAVAIVAVLSPKCPWEKNIEYSRNLILKQGPCGALGPNQKKAKRILKLKTTKALFNHLRGPKVQSFYLNIMNRGYDSNVTVDVHMKNLIEPHMSQVGKAVYWRISERIRELARIVGYAPPQVQATLWTVQRNNSTESGYHN